MTRKTTNRSAQPTTHWVWMAYSTERGMAFATDLGGMDAEGQRRVVYGEALDPVPKVAVKATTPGRFYDQLGSYLGVLIVSPKLRAVLDEASGARIQWIPVGVRGKPDLRYFLANVLDKVPAVDPKGSKILHYEGSDTISGIAKIVPRKIPSDAPPIFHIAEVPILVAVRDDLRRRLQEASEHPGDFVPLEKFKLE